MAWHLVVRAAPGTVLFRTHVEARALWERVCAAFPDLIAACLMPDHLHLVLPHPDPDGRLAALCSGYARWRNHHRDERGAVFSPAPPPEEIPDAAHLRRTIRYVHLNPSRKGLVEDPLAWPWSTHRDYVGFAAPAVVDTHTTPERFHGYVSADPTVHVEGTSLPILRRESFGLDAIVEAVSAVTRAPTSSLVTAGAPRTLALQCAWARDLRDVGLLATRFDCERTTVWRTVRALPEGLLKGKSPPLKACILAVGDDRMRALGPGDLRPTWAPYRRLR